MQMNKSGYSFTISVFLAVMIFISCSDNQAVRLRYQAERMFHEAERSLKQLQIKPDLATDAGKRKTAQLYSQTTRFCFNSLDSIRSQSESQNFLQIKQLAFQSSTRLSQLYFAGRQYDSCVAIANRILVNLSLTGQPVAITLVNLGRALQASHMWDSAVSVYAEAVASMYPPMDDEGNIIRAIFTLPFQTFSLSKMVEDSIGADIWLEQAHEYYGDLARSFPNSAVAPASHAMLSRIYQETGQWELVVEELNWIVADTSHQEYVSTRLRIADIYALKLGDFDRALDIYQDILKRVDAEDSQLIPFVRFKTCQIAMERKQYSAARRTINKIRNDYPGFFANMPGAQFTLARSFELDGKWNRAESEYNLLIEKYPVSDEAMSTLIYIANLLEEKNQKAAAERWYQRAEDHYRDISRRASGTIDDARALGYMAGLYERRGDWSQSAEILLSIYDRFPDTDPGRQSLIRASAIYRERLDDKAGADSLLQALKVAMTTQPENWVD